MPLTAAEKQDIKLALLKGLGVPMREIAAQLGRKEMTLYKRRMRGDFEWIEETIKSQFEICIAKRTKEIQDKADIKMRAHEKAWKLKEKALDEGLRATRRVVTKDGEIEEIDNPVNATQAAIAMNVVDRVEGKPLDRRAILERKENVSRVELSIDDIEDFMTEVRQIARGAPAGLLEAAEAELVESVG